MSEKVRVTLRLRQEALELVLQQGYATRRTLGEFLSQLILDYHQWQRLSVIPYPLLEDWRQLVEDTEQLLRTESNKTK